jgi:hypothetical protein
MIFRCTNPKSPAYPNYGGRGINVCDRWLDFDNFMDDIGSIPVGMSIDRKDNDGNYEPNNVRLADAKQQASNMRVNHLLTHAGETLTITEWSRRIGITYGGILRRLRCGWSVDRALTQPRLQ